MTRRRWMGSILAIVAFLVASGIALAVTFYQASERSARRSKRPLDRSDKR